MHEPLTGEAPEGRVRIEARGEVALGLDAGGVAGVGGIADSARRQVDDAVARHRDRRRPAAEVEHRGGRQLEPLADRQRATSDIQPATRATTDVGDRHRSAALLVCVAGGTQDQFVADGRRPSTDHIPGGIRQLHIPRYRECSAALLVARTVLHIQVAFGEVVACSNLEHTARLRERRRLVGRADVVVVRPGSQSTAGDRRVGLEPQVVGKAAAPIVTRREQTA